MVVWVCEWRVGDGAEGCQLGLAPLGMEALILSTLQLLYTYICTLNIEHIWEMSRFVSLSPSLRSIPLSLTAWGRPSQTLVLPSHY